MFRNCLAAALRHLAHSRLYTAISVAGLAVGIAAAMLAALVPRNQLNQDHFIPGYERIYMAVIGVTPPGTPGIYLPSASTFVARELALRFSEIEAVTRLFPMYPITLRHDRIAAPEGLYYADPNALDVLKVPVVAGDPHATLARPDGVVLNVSTARKYFGRDLPLGETLLLSGDRVPGGSHALTVGAVIRDLPANGTHLRSGIFVSAQGAWTELHIEETNPSINKPGSEPGFGTQTYVKLAPHASPEHLLASMPRITAELFTRPPPGTKVEQLLVRMDRINAFPAFDPRFYTRLLTLALVGGGVLVIALMNFVTLQTALSARRAREIAVRKLAGGSRWMLVAQLLTESVIYVLVAAVLGIALTEWLLPWANTFLDAGATFEYWREPALLGTVIAAAVALGMLAGAGPAWQLAACQPAAVLKGTAAHRGSTPGRLVLVTVQFAVLTALMIGTGVIYLQRHFATQEALRVDTEQMLLVRGGCRPAFVAQVSQLPGVRGAACSASGWLTMPTGGPTAAGAQYMMPKDRRGVEQLAYCVHVEPSLLGLYGVQPVAGALPQGGTASGYVLNETAARRLGFTNPAEAVGFALTDCRDLRGGGTAVSGATLPVTAVVPDLSLDSVERKIEALAYLTTTATPADDQLDLISIRLTGQQIPETLAAIDRIWQTAGDGKPINKQFLDAHIQSLYLSLLREAQLLAVFAAAAVGLGCLGLLGLAASITQRRSREIGIRKALGADTGHVFSLLLRELGRPVLWANLLAWPVAAWTMKRWLDGFPYHMDLPLWLFPAVALLAVLIALVTVSAHAAGAARSRPVAVLRYE